MARNEKFGGHYYQESGGEAVDLSPEVASQLLETEQAQRTMHAMGETALVGAELGEKEVVPMYLDERGYPRGGVPGKKDIEAMGGLTKVRSRVAKSELARVGASVKSGARNDMLKNKRMKVSGELVEDIQSDVAETISKYTNIIDHLSRGSGPKHRKSFDAVSRSVFSGLEGVRVSLEGRIGLDGWSRDAVEPLLTKVQELEHHIIDTREELEIK